MKKIKEITEIKFTVELTDQEVKTICEALDRASEQDEASLAGDEFIDGEKKELKKSVKAMDKLYSELSSLIYEKDED